ncbi:MAG TPA: tetratricopeptide repeat protein [bacterium]|nr:tetratricopeptide repeat protein [bacterium]
MHIVFAGVTFLLPLAVLGSFRDAYMFPKWALGIGFAGVFLLLAAKRGSVPGCPALRNFRDVPLLLIALLLLLHMVSLPWSINPWTALAATGILLAAGIWYVAGACLLARDRAMIRWTVSVVSAGLIVSVYGGMQLLGWDFRGSGFFDPVSTLGHRNFVAQFLIIVIPMACWLGVQAPKRWIQGLGCITVLTSTGHLLATTCRGAWVGALAGGCVAGILLCRRKESFKRWIHTAGGVLLSVLIIGAIMMAIPTLRHRALSIADIDQGTNRFRLLVWSSTLKMVRDHPLAGVGPGNFGHAYPQYRDIRERRLSGDDVYVRAAHNDFLQTAAETGIAGGLIMIGFFAVLYRRYFREIRTVKSLLPFACQRAGFLIAGAAAVTATGIHAMFSMNLRNPAPLFLIMAVAGASAGSAGKPESDPDGRISTAVRGILTVAGVILLAGTVMFGLRQVASARGIQAENRGDYPAAADHFQNAVTAWPGTYNDWYHIGYCRLMAGQPERAKSPLERSVDLSPGFTNAWFNLGLAAEQTGDPGGAAEAYCRALAIDPLHTDSLNNLGYIRAQQERPGEAETLFRRLLDIEPDSADAWNNLGIVLIQQNDLNGAEEAFLTGLAMRRRLRFDGSTTRHFALFGTIRFRGWPLSRPPTGGDDPPWGSVFFPARPGMSPEIINPGNGVTASYDADTGDLWVSMESDPSSGECGYILQYRVRDFQGETTLNTCETLDADLWNNLGYCHESAGRLDAARQCYQRALTINPSDQRAQRNAARLTAPVSGPDY